MTKMIAANWKMYKTAEEASDMLNSLAPLIRNVTCDILVFAPFTALHTTVPALKNIPCAQAGAQDVYPAHQGAFTGEISPDMLLAAGCSWVLTGHSERRHILGESPEFVGQKTAFSLASGLNVMLCIGETLAERDNGQLSTVLEQQLREGLRDVPPDIDASRLCIAYEPVWAIGTGKTASDADILAAHAEVRRLLIALRGSSASNLRILYGGSVKPDNAKRILPLDNVDGLLIGGSSLQAESFAAIIQCAQSLARN